MKTGHTGAAGWCQVAAVRGPGGTIVYATLLGGPSRAVRNADLRALLVWGEAQFRVVPVVQTGRVYARAQLPYGEKPLALVASSRCSRPRASTGRSPSASWPRRPSRYRCGVALFSVTSRSGPAEATVGRRDLVAARAVPRPTAMRRLGWYAGRTASHLVHLLSP